MLVVIVNRCSVRVVQGVGYGNVKIGPTKAIVAVAPHDVHESIGHVEEGVRLAKQAGLPSLLIDFIQTHHGTTRTAYFYHQHLGRQAVIQSIGKLSPTQGFRRRVCDKICELTNFV